MAGSYVCGWGRRYLILWAWSMAQERLRLRVSGTVQGVGFRPFVYGLAHRLTLTGAIGNDDDGVWCEVQGKSADLARFRTALICDAPPLARIDEVGIAPVDVVSGETTFRILPSAPGSAAAAVSVPPDVAPCARCLDEIDAPSNRRAAYAFTCCTNCGPRYTVVTGLPYDRERTSMAAFALCPACAHEYASPTDRRHHAQATCCPCCGPTLLFHTLDGRAVPGDPLSEAAALLVDGDVLAVKGAGGFQLMCRADDDEAVTRLRRRKHRDEKPFALLVSSLERARDLAVLDEVSADALSGPEAPIVLAPRAPGAPVAASVAPDSRLLGVMLPATPLHHLLSAASGLDLVCTSGNRSSEPISTQDDDAIARLGGIADGMLTHDRRIVRPADDSVGQTTCGRFQLLRRARGFAPRPVRLSQPGPPVLGVGAELKSTVCLGEGRDAHVSVHLGDLEHPSTLETFERSIADLMAMLRVEPALVAHDLHPEYLSTKFARAQVLAPTLGVQHHHAHLASCLADNAHAGPVIGVTFDGAGWGPDETLWGGEFLIGDATGFERAGHLARVPLPGGAAATREPWRMAVAHMHATFGEPLADLPVVDRHRDTVGHIVAMCANPRTVATSSIGRLFDAVAAICDLADRSSYEGQAAILLEQAATEADSSYPWGIDDRASPLTIDARPVIRTIVEDRRNGRSVGAIAGAFHRSVAQLIADVSVRLRERSGLSTVALSGGVFQNRLLVELAVPLLIGLGFDALRHAQVPPNDGGISLGQVAVARAHLLTQQG